MIPKNPLDNPFLRRLSVQWTASSSMAVLDDDHCVTCEECVLIGAQEPPPRLGLRAILASSRGQRHVGPGG